MTFEVWGGAIADKECTFNSVELRAVDVQLEPCQQLGLGVVRRSARQVRSRSNAITKAVVEKRAPRPEGANLGHSKC